MTLARTLLCTAIATGGLALPEVARADPTTVEWSDAWPRVHLWEVIDALPLTVGDTVSGSVLPSLMHSGFGSGRPIGEVDTGSLHKLPTLVPRPGGTELGMVGGL